MAQLRDLPIELKIAVIDELVATDKDPDEIVTSHAALRSLLSLAQTCRLFHRLIDPILCRETLRTYPYLLCWAAQTDNLEAMKHFLKAGANPNMALKRFSYGKYEDEGALDTIQSWGKLIGEHDYSDCMAHWDTQIYSEENWLEFVGENALDCNHLIFPIHLASVKGNIEAFDLLQRFGADMNAPALDFCDNCEDAPWKDEPRHIEYSFRLGNFEGSDYLWTCFHLALCHKHHTLAKHILDLDLDGNDQLVYERFRFQNEFALSPPSVFVSAVFHGDLELADYILSEGIEEVEQVYRGIRYGTLMWMAYWQGPEVFEKALPILLRHGADIDADVGEGHTLLIEACSTTSYTEAGLLVDAGANVNIRLKEPNESSIMSPHFQPPGELYWKDICRDFECNCNLPHLHPPIEPNSTFIGMRPIDMCSQPYFYVATMIGSEECSMHGHPHSESIVKRLLRAGPLGVLDANPLFIAASSHQVHLVKALLEEGVAVDSRDTWGWSALKHALHPKLGSKTLQWHLQDIVEVLAEHACDNGFLLEDSIWAMERLEMLSIQAYGDRQAIHALGGARSKGQITPLMLAFDLKSFEVWKCFIKHGITPEWPTKYDICDVQYDDFASLWDQLLHKKTQDGKLLHGRDSFELLSAKEADPTNHLFASRQFWDAAVKAGRDDVTTWMEEKGFRPTVDDSQGSPRASSQSEDSVRFQHNLDVLNRSFPRRRVCLSTRTWDIEYPGTESQNASVERGDDLDDMPGSNSSASPSPDGDEIDER